MAHRRLKLTMLFVLTLLDLLIPAWLVNDWLIQRTLSGVLAPYTIVFLQNGENIIANLRPTDSLELGYAGIISVWLGIVALSVFLFHSYRKDRRRRKRFSSNLATAAASSLNGKSNPLHLIGSDYCHLGLAGCEAPATKMLKEEFLNQQESPLAICASCRRSVCYNCSEARNFYLYGQVRLCHECLRGGYSKRALARN